MPPTQPPPLHLLCSAQLSRPTEVFTCSPWTSCPARLLLHPRKVEHPCRQASRRDAWSLGHYTLFSKEKCLGKLELSESRKDVQGHGQPPRGPGRPGPCSWSDPIGPWPHVCPVGALGGASAMGLPVDGSLTCPKGPPFLSPDSLGQCYPGAAPAFSPQPYRVGCLPAASTAGPVTRCQPFPSALNSHVLSPSPGPSLARIGSVLNPGLVNLKRILKVGWGLRSLYS